MKAIVYERYGTPDVLALREVEPPTVRDADVLIRTRAAAIGAGDWHLLNATWFAVRLYQGLRRPRRPILGHEVAGTVEAVGPAVTRFRPGDEVLGTSDDAGCFAELVRVPEQALVRRPEDLSPEAAAALPVSGVTALQGLRDHGKLRSGQRVLVNGASGGVGTYAVQIARALGARVTGTASAGKLDLVRSLGAEAALDYRQHDFTQGEERFDVVLDTVGDRPLADCKRALTPGGIYVAVSGHPLRSLWIGVAGGKRATAFIAKNRAEDLAFLLELVAKGELGPVVDRSFPLAEVPDALRYFGARKARGKIVVTV